MNKKDILQLIARIFSNYLFHPRCMDEIKALLLKELRGKEARFFNVLQAQFNNIHEFGPMISQVDSHERLKHCSKPYYSIHLKQNQFNIRLLAYITLENPPLFLGIFYERSGKSATDYSQWIPVLDNRLKEMMEGNNYES